VADAENVAQASQAAELESAASNYLQDQIDAGKIDAFETASDATVKEDSTLLIDQDGKQYGALTMEAAAGKQGTETFIVMSYDPGNPFQMARFIAIGAVLLLALHLFGLSRAEAAAKRRTEATA
jgi:hypothetical protein